MAERKKSLNIVLNNLKAQKELNAINFLNERLGTEPMEVLAEKYKKLFGKYGEAIEFVEGKFRRKKKEQ